MLAILREDPIFSEFSVFNPDCRRRYRVAIRGARTARQSLFESNFATNDLGTCKYIEFTLT